MPTWVYILAAIPAGLAAVWIAAIVVRAAVTVSILKDPDAAVVHTTVGDRHYFYANQIRSKEVMLEVIKQLKEHNQNYPDNKVWWKRTWLRGLVVKNEYIRKEIYEAFSHGGPCPINNLCGLGIVIDT